MLHYSHEPQKISKIFTQKKADITFQGKLLFAGLKRLSPYQLVNYNLLRMIFQIKHLLEITLAKANYKIS